MTEINYRRDVRKHGKQRHSTEFRHAKFDENHRHGYAYEGIWSRKAKRWCVKMWKRKNRRRERQRLLKILR